MNEGGNRETCFHIYISNVLNWILRDYIISVLFPSEDIMAEYNCRLRLGEHLTLFSDKNCSLYFHLVWTTFFCSHLKYLCLQVVNDVFFKTKIFLVLCFKMKLGLNSFFYSTYIYWVSAMWQALFCGGRENSFICSTKFSCKI